MNTITRTKILLAVFSVSLAGLGLTASMQKLAQVGTTPTPVAGCSIPIGIGPHSSPARVGTKLYAANQSSHDVSVIDTTTNAVIATIRVGYAPSSTPTLVGTKLYVTNFGTNNVSVIDTVTDTVIATIGVGSGPRSSPTLLGTKLYIANEGSNDVSVIDTVTDTVIATIGVGTGPYSSPTVVGTKLYVANKNSHNVSVIDTTTNTLIATINVGLNPSSSPTLAGTKLYVANANTQNVSVIDTTTNTVIATIKNIGLFPYSSPTLVGTMLYVASSGAESEASGKVTVIHTATDTVITSIGVDGRAYSSPTLVGTKLYVTTEEGYVSVIDTTTNTLLDTDLNVGMRPRSSPTLVGTKLYVAKNDSTILNVIDMTTDTFVRACDTNAPSAAQCSDNKDNDLDNLYDFPQDPGCANAQDNDESNGITLVVGTPDMTAATDTGVSNTDNITTDATPDFTGTCSQNSGGTIALLVDNVYTGAIGACMQGRYAITAANISPGNHVIAARQSDGAGNVATSPSLAIIIAVTPPVPTALCNDGTVQTGEQCDDGNQSNIDGCTNACRLAACGDGFKQGTEACDDGNQIDTDACKNNCTIPVATPPTPPTPVPPIASSTTVIDDGDAGFAAGSFAQSPYNLGYGTPPDTAYFSPIGRSVANTTPASWTFSTITEGKYEIYATYGSYINRTKKAVYTIVTGTNTPTYATVDQTKTPTGLTVNGRSWQLLGVVTISSNQPIVVSLAPSSDSVALADAVMLVRKSTPPPTTTPAPFCPTADCTAGFTCSEAMRSCVPETPVCGNGLVQTGEQCDDGNKIDTDSCKNNCSLPPSIVCGNGIVQTGEQCDDGNQTSTDGCTHFCTIAACGDGFRQGNEECDDGNGYNADICTNACKIARCGDGFKQGSEGCDDGNQLNTDGCTNFCTLPSIVCGNGIVQAGEQCDDGNQLNTDGCTNFCKIAVCRDGFKQGSEACDDGNQIDTDTCKNNCTIPVATPPTPPTPVPPIASSTTVIIDDGDIGYAGVNMSGPIDYYIGFNGDTAYFVPQKNVTSVNSSARWTFTNLEEGTYDVYATWGEHLNRTKKAEFKIFENGTPTYVDQTKRPPTMINTRPWKLLGTAIVGSDKSIVVILKMGTDAITLADAMMVIKK